MDSSYTVFVRLALQNQVSAGLLGMSGQFKALNAQAEILQARLSSIKKLGMVGAGMFLGGIFGLHMFDKTLKYGEEYAHQLNIMNMAGVSQVDMANAIGDAWKVTGKVITTTAIENLRMLNDMRIVFGDMGEARLALPLVAQMQAVLMSSKEGKSASQDKDFAFSVAKALDIIGAVKNKEEFMTEANMMAKTVTAFQGRVTPKMFQSTFAYARQAKYALDNQFKYEILPTLMMEYAISGQGAGGGSRGVGPMIAAMYRMTNQGYINKKALPELERVGLVAKNSALKTTTSGTTVGSMTNFQLAGKNPFLWVQQTLVPLLQKTYGHDGKALTREELQYHINQLFRGNQLAASLITEFAVKPYAFLRDQKLIKQAMSPEQAYQLALMSDPGIARSALSAQWDNVMTALTVPMVSVLIPALVTLATGLNEFGRVLIEYPLLAKTLSFAFVGLAASMAFGGTIILLTAAFKGLALTMTLFGLVAASTAAAFLLPFTALSLFAYGAYKLGMLLMSIDWGKVWGSIKLFFSMVGHSIVNALTPVGTAIVSFFQNLGKNILIALGNSILPGLGSGANAVYNAVTTKGSSGQTVQVHSSVHLDGAKIGTSVTKHQVKSASSISNYTSVFDRGMTQTPVMLTGGAYG